MNKPTLDDFEAVRTVVNALEGFETKEQQRIIRWACEKIGLIGAGGAMPANAGSPITAAPLMPNAEVKPLHDSAGRARDIKSFMAEKAPKSDAQFAAAAAYYYRFEAPADQRKESISKDDLIDASRLTNRKRPARPAQTLVNAHKLGLLDKGSDRGHYVVSTVGENLVAMAMPDGSNGIQGVAPRAARRVGRAPKSKRTHEKRPVRK